MSHIEYLREPVEVWAIRIWEIDPPAGVAPIEWFLLTSEVVETPQDLIRLATWYSPRWMIEEYHKVQKSGVRVEQVQVQTVEAMAVWVALLRAVAVALLNLRSVAQISEWPSRPAEEFVPPLWVAVLRQIAGSPSGTANWTVADFSWSWLVGADTGRIRKSIHRVGSPYGKAGRISKSQFTPSCPDQKSLELSGVSEG